MKPKEIRGGISSSILTYKEKGAQFSMPLFPFGWLSWRKKPREIRHCGSIIIWFGFGFNSNPIRTKFEEAVNRNLIRI